MSLPVSCTKSLVKGLVANVKALLEHEMSAGNRETCMGTSDVGPGYVLVMRLRR